MNEEIYTEQECIDAIKDITEALASLRRRPNQASLDGNFVSFAGKSSELRSELVVWRQRLHAIRNANNDTSPMQGPKRRI